MPANLTAQYHKAEAAYRQAETPEEELECLQWMLREIPKHKGTDKLQAELKSKIARLKAELARQSKTAAQRPSHRIPKQGAGRIVLVGAPNVGKSSLLKALTRAKPEIGDYPFTTQAPQPGMMYFEDCPMQLIDLPPVTPDYLDPVTTGLIRGADLALLVVDLGSDTLVEDTQGVLSRFESGKTRLGMTSGVDEQDVGVSFTQTVVLLNKVDAPGAAERRELLREFLPLPYEQLAVSATTGTGLDELRRLAFERLGVVRVYTKHPKEKEPDLSKPFTVRRGETLLAVAEQVHRDLAAQLKSARVWGKAVHPGTVVKPDYQPVDGDIVELHAS